MLTSCQEKVSRGNPWGMVTNENLAGQRKQLGCEICMTAVVTPSQEHEEGRNQPGLCKLQQQRFCFPSPGEEFSHL